MAIYTQQYEFFDSDDDEDVWWLFSDEVEQTYVEIFALLETKLPIIQQGQHMERVAAYLSEMMWQKHFEGKHT